MISENELIKKFQETQSEEYYTELYNKYSNLTFRKCYSFIGNKQDAEEVTQDIWVKVYFSLKAFQFESSFNTWLFTINP